MLSLFLPLLLFLCVVFNLILLILLFHCIIPKKTIDLCIRLELVLFLIYCAELSVMYSPSAIYNMYMRIYDNKTNLWYCSFTLNYINLHGHKLVQPLLRYRSVPWLVLVWPRNKVITFKDLILFYLLGFSWRFAVS